MGVVINSEKTEVQHIRASTEQVNITISGIKLKQATQFSYLRGAMTEEGNTELDVERRIGIAGGVMKSLNTSKQAYSIKTT